MSIKFRCSDYGYECELVLDEELTMSMIEKLRDHQNNAHKDFFESHEKDIKREPAPGDVTVF